MTDLITFPSWFDAALEFSIAKTHHNLATLASFPERTGDGHWAQIDPERPGWACPGFSL